MKHKLNRYL